MFMILIKIPAIDTNELLTAHVAINWSFATPKKIHKSWMLELVTNYKIKMFFWN